MAMPAHASFVRGALDAAAAGGTFAMKEPFEFSIEPEDLLEEEG